MLLLIYEAMTYDRQSLQQKYLKRTTWVGMISVVSV